MEGLGTAIQKLLDALDGGVQRHYERSGSPFRPRFYPVAQALLGGGALSIRALSNRTGVSHSAVSQTVAAMRTAGLVTSAPGPKDARERVVALTPEGLATCGRHACLWRAVAEAASELNAELPMPLDVLVREALQRLGQEPFADRIERHLRTLDPDHLHVAENPVELET